MDVDVVAGDGTTRREPRDAAMSPSSVIRSDQRRWPASPAASPTTAATSTASCASPAIRSRPSSSRCPASTRPSCAPGSPSPRPRSGSTSPSSGPACSAGPSGSSCWMSTRPWCRARSSRCSPSGPAAPTRSRPSPRRPCAATWTSPNPCASGCDSLRASTSSAIDDVRRELLLTAGARTFVRTLKRLDYKLAIVSGGFTQITDQLVAELGIDYLRREHPRDRRRSAHRRPGRRRRRPGGQGGRARAVRRRSRASP